MVVQSLTVNHTFSQNFPQVVLHAEYAGRNLLWLEQLEIFVSMGSREGAVL